MVNVHLGKQVDKLQPQFTSDVQIVGQFVRPDDLFISSVKTAIKASLCLLMFLVEKRFIFSEGPIMHSHLGVQGWRSGESTRLPPMWPGFDSQIRRQMGVEFVGSLLCTERFSPGTPVSPLLKNQNLT